MNSNKSIYRLYKCSRSYGNKKIRETHLKEYVMEDTNMNVLMEYILSNNEKLYTFIIEKYINNEIRWRQLGKSKSKRRNVDGWVKGDLTTTWEKYVWNDIEKKWRISNYRYKDEIIL